tara:strand:- start:6805 stop:7746 length:942 start_codon:yes stop_codon:yes gene_type:complete
MNKKTNKFKANLEFYFQKAEEFLGLHIQENIKLLCLKLVLVFLLFFMTDDKYLIIAMPVILIPGILFNGVASNKYYWAFLAILTIILYLILDFVGFYIPNHKHIYAYVCLAITFVLFFSKNTKILEGIKIQSKFIIGLCFLFATTGKFLAPEFLNGSFFVFTNTIDPRFFGFTSLMGNIDFQDLLHNQNNFHDLLNTTDPDKIFQLNGAQKLNGIALILSYWTIFIEGMIAISFISPNKFKISKYRNIFLITFILTTYPIATVPGFAYVLTTLGFIQSVEKEKITGYSWFYLFVFILLPLIEIPFSEVVSLLF